MGYLDQLAGGLRSAAGVLSPDVQRQTAEQDQRRELIRQQQAQMLVTALAKQVADGTMPKEAAQAAAAAKGLNVPPELFGGPSVETQARLRKMAQEDAFRKAINQLGPNATQEQLAAVSAQFGSPGDVLKTQQASLDRAATRDATLAAARERIAAQVETAQERMRAQVEAARQRGEDQRAIARIVQEGRAELARLTASMRQPPAVSATTVADPADPTKSIVIDSRTGRKIGDAPAKLMSEKAPTEFQGKNALFGVRANQADKILKQLEDKISLEGLAAKQAVQNIPVIGGLAGVAGNAMLSANQQSVEQAQRNFVNAVLRQESGAVISDAEFANAKKQYFPQPGDSKQVIEQKRRNRETAIAGFKKIAGPAWFDVNDPSSILDQADAIIGGK